jgi:tellurite resistance protein
VAWADGKVTRQERELLLEAARLHGVAEDNAAYKQLIDWTENRPSEEFFEHTLRIVSDLLETAPRADGKTARDGMIEDSKRMAVASGGILGFGSRISDEEQALLERIAAVVGKRDRSAE